MLTCHIVFWKCSTTHSEKFSSVEHAISWRGGEVHFSLLPVLGGPVTVNPIYPRWYHKTPRVYPPLSDISSFSDPFSLYQDPRSDPERPWSNHFPRLLVFNTQCIIKQIPHPDRKKIEQLIRLELSQFMAKLKRVPTMDKSRRGRKSMTGRTGVSPRFSRSARRWESVAGSCLIYTWFFLSFLHICSAISWNNGHYLGWKVNVTVWGVIHHHLLSSAKALSSPALWAA